MAAQRKNPKEVTVSLAVKLNLQDKKVEGRRGMLMV